MSLYDHLGRVYDLVFPFLPKSARVIASLVPESGPKRLIDAGAASGALVRAFEHAGWQALGIEINHAMADRAGPPVIEGSMTEIREIASQYFGSEARCGAITCLGNTLPHLHPSEREPFLKDAKSLLGPGCPIILQLLNYDLPELTAGFHFPDIRTGGIFFRRWYESGSERNSLVFITELTVDCEQYRDSTVLYPVGLSILKPMLADAGFAMIQVYENWELKPFDPDSSMYAIVAARSQ